MSHTLDNIDKAILNLLQDDATVLSGNVASSCSKFKIALSILSKVWLISGHP